MFGISLTEFIIILTVALIVLGPDKLPELMHTIGKLMGRLQKEFDGVRREFYSSVYEPASEMKARFNAAAKDLVAIADPDMGKSHTKTAKIGEVETDQDEESS